MILLSGGFTRSRLTNDNEKTMPYFIICWLSASTLFLSGCPRLASGYWIRVLAHTTEEQAKELQNSRDLGKLPGVRKIRAEKAPCAEYARYVPSAGIELVIRECAGPNKDSVTGWGYWADVTTYSGDLPGVRGETDRFLDELQKRLKEKIGDVKITSKEQPLRLP
jgi:hypothetical protein